MINYSKDSIRLKEMLIIQNELNSIQNKFWRYELKSSELAIAVIVECGELCDHLNYKWWGNQSKSIDISQVKLELVDIWHFLLSEFFAKGKDVNFILSSIDEDFVERGTVGEFNGQNLLQAVGEFLNVFAGDRFAKDTYIECFGILLNYACMTFAELYRLYIGKSTLNLFRWSHGYREGTYIKIWDGLEDNEHLTRILDDIPEDDLNSENIMKQLEKIYSSITQSQTI